MKEKLLLLLLLQFSVGLAQKSEHFLTTEDISLMERRSHEKFFNVRERASRTSASDNFDVTYYRCQWEVDPNVKAITGTVTTHFIMKSAGSVISLDLADNLAIASVKQKNVPLQFTHSNNTVTITFPAAIASGSRDSVSITYGGVPSSPNGTFVTTTHGSGATLAPILWTLSEPFGSKDWWPCKNGLDDKADSIDVYITHPKAYKAVSNGILQSETDIADNKQISYWKHRYPIASYLVCMAVSNYLVLHDGSTVLGEQINMQTFCYPENVSSFAAGALNALIQIDFYSNLFEKYPFRKEKYGHVQFGWGGGMEHQTSSFMVNMNEGLIAHELAHQWFGNKITCGNWEDIWLNEGFATHLASMFMEDKYPASVKTNRINEINSITSLPDGSVRVDNVNDVNRIFSKRLSYYKGSHLLYMLRWILGDAVFRTAVKNYINDPALAYGFATTNHLKSHLETASGKNLTYFFDQWYTGQGFPTYQVDWFPSNTSVQIKLSQTSSHASVGFFQLPVPLLFKNSITNEQKLVTLNNTSNGQVFIENLGFVADQVVFDPEAWLITRDNLLTKVSSQLPVTFSSFNATCMDNDVALMWETSEEVNADYFEIQRSTDAVFWEKVGSIKAVGDSKARNTYRFVDGSASLQKAYYRIVEYDRDGKFQQTRIVATQCNAAEESQVVLSPNPIDDYLNLSVPASFKEPISIDIYDGSGIVRQQEEYFYSAEGKSINVSKLPSGLYLLKWVSHNSKDWGTIRFLKE